MGIVPSGRVEKIEFYEAHMSAWTTNAVAIGLTAAKVTALGTLVTQARAAFNAAEVARQASKAATQAFYDKVNAMHAGPDGGQDLINQIRNCAQSKNDPNVWVLAQLPAPTPPGVAPPPGTPFEFTVNLFQSGAIELKWKCNNPQGTTGTIYEVFRKVGSGNFDYVGSTGVRSFVDDTLPAGSPNAIYRITAVRSTQRGTAAQFNVSFGVDGPGLTMENTETDAEVRLAA